MIMIMKENEFYESVIQESKKKIESELNDKHWYYHQQGEAKTKLEQYESAIKDLDEAIKLKPDESWHYFHRALANFELEQYESAIKDLDEAIKLKPDETWRYFHRARAKKELKKYRDAIKDLDEAINWYPLNYAAYKMREEISAKLGQEVE